MKRLAKRAAAHLWFNLRRAWAWIAERPLHQTGLRIYVQVYRRITGAPLRRYSEIEPLLFVGGQHYPAGLATLHDWGIRAVLNLRREFDDAAAGVAMEHYLHLIIRDNTAPTQAQLRAGVDFITQQIQARRGVYIHCGVGVGRAPTLAAAYLVSTGLTPKEAWARLRAVRPFIWPNRRQRASVQHFAESIGVRPDDDPAS
jgi:predicted protein tyrosine phosphatase